jgi:hypothetical protein
MELEEFFSKKQERIDWSADYNLNPFFKLLSERLDTPVTVLACSDPVSGEYGFLITYIDDKDEEHTVYLMNKVFEKAARVKHESFPSIKKAYDEAIKNDWIIEKCGEPKQLQLGFIVTKTDSRTWHTISIKEFKRRKISRPLKSKESRAIDDLLGTIDGVNEDLAKAIANQLAEILDKKNKGE